MTIFKVHVIAALLILFTWSVCGNIYEMVLPEIIVYGEESNVRFVTARPLENEGDDGEEEEEDETPLIHVYNDIELAIEEAADGDYVWFLEGEYTANIEVSKPLYMMAGFPDDGRDFWDYSLEDRQWWYYRVVIEPETDDTVVRINTDGTFIILFDGFEVRGGTTDIAGGGIFNHGGAVFNSSIHSCSSEYVGGGIYNHAGYILNCVIFDNYAAHYGGGIYNNDGHVQNCTVVRNQAKYGAGIYQYTPDPEEGMGKIINTVSWHNEWSVEDNGETIKIWSDIHNSQGSVINSCFRRIEGSIGSIDENPILRDPFWQGPDPRPETGLIPQSDSPVINTGTEDEEYYIIIPFDITGRPRISGASVDMGAFEYQH